MMTFAFVDLSSLSLTKRTFAYSLYGSSERLVNAHRTNEARALAPVIVRTLRPTMTSVAMFSRHALYGKWLPVVARTVNIAIYRR
jgi:hypothetical protein